MCDQRAGRHAHRPQCFGGLPPWRSSRAELLEAPLAAQRPHVLEAHGDVRQDEYYWLRDDERKDPAVIAHLEVGAC